MESGVYYGWAGLDIELPSSLPPSEKASPVEATASSQSTAARPEKSVDGVGADQSKEVDGVDGVGTGRNRRGTVFPMVMSIGWNPFYKNTVRSVVRPPTSLHSLPPSFNQANPPTPFSKQEVHLLHTFPENFYDTHMNLVILGFIRPEYDYVSKDSLIEDIREDIEVARRSLARERYVCWKEDGYLWEFEGEEKGGDVGS